jgi:hypothetical protein
VKVMQERALPSLAFLCLSKATHLWRTVRYRTEINFLGANLLAGAAKTLLVTNGQHYFFVSFRFQALRFTMTEPYK